LGVILVAVEAISIFRLVFVILKPTKMSTSGDESGAELPELTKVTKATTAPFIYTPLITYLALLWLRSVSESLARRDGH
jgi:hypothetical protein